MVKDHFEVLVFWLNTHNMYSISLLKFLFGLIDFANHW